MASKLETSYSGMFLDTKIRTLLNDLNKELINSNLSTKEDISSLFNKVVKDYYSNLHKALFKYKEVNKGNNPDLTKMNLDNYTIYNDLVILYSSLKNIRNLLASNYNTLSGMSLKIKTDIAEASSKLIDYKIQNTNKLEPLFSDSFFNLSKVESDDSKYTKSKAFIDTFNNNVVLPLDSEAESLKIKTLRIVEDSVGTSGNNQEINSIARDNIKMAIDNSIDTWFEFEQVGVNELQLPTILNLKIEFEEEKIFNLLDISTVQMPNGSYPAILDIKGSMDGSAFFDLKSLFLGEITKDSIGNEIIQLGENPSNPNGGNMLYFSPRKIKFLSIKFIEDSSYFIKTSAGIKYRRAIGIKELKAKSQKFKNEGQLITTNFLSNKEISKISLFTKEYAVPNFKNTFNYFISVDNGQNWDPINPSQKVKDKIPEILNYNIDFLESSKKTDFPVASVKVKCEFKIEEGEEATSITAGFTKQNKTEFTNLSAGTRTISLEQKPFGSVFLYQTNFGSVGRSNYFKIPNSSLKELTDRYIVQLPLQIFPSESIQIDQEELFVDNYQWSRVNTISSSDDPTDLIYEFDYLNNIITFAKTFSGNQAGKKPSGDIFFKLKRENVKLIPQASGALFKTRLPHDGIKENISIYKLSETLSEKGFKLRNLASLHRLGVTEIDHISILQDINNKLQNEKSYINGVVELSGNGDYSIDKKNGIIFTYQALNSTEEVLINVFYKAKTDVTFSIDNGDLLTQEVIKIDNKTFNIDIPSETYAVSLGFSNIQKNTISFIDFPSELTLEVPLENMEVLFNTPNTSGQYAIDYEQGILYSQDKILGKLSGTLSNTNYFAEYNVTYKIPESSYTVIPNEKKIELSDKFVSDFFNTSANETQTPTLLKVSYVYTQEVKESLGELLAYTTPFIMEYKIITALKESL